MTHKVGFPWWAFHFSFRIHYITINTSNSDFGQAMYFKHDTHQRQVQCHKEKQQGKFSWCSLSLTLVISAGPAPLNCTFPRSWQMTFKLPRQFFSCFFFYENIWQMRNTVLNRILGRCAHVCGGYLGHQDLVETYYPATPPPQPIICNIHSSNWADLPK